MHGLRHLRGLLAVLLVSILPCGCAVYTASPAFPNYQATQIVLKENDFKVVKAHLVGTASCQYILGIALGDPKIHSRALGEISQAAGAVGKSAQLINWTCDNVQTSLLGLWLEQKVVYSADLIEFDK